MADLRGIPFSILGGEGRRVICWKKSLEKGEEGTLDGTIGKTHGGEDIFGREF